MKFKTYFKAITEVIKFRNSLNITNPVFDIVTDQTIKRVYLLNGKTVIYSCDYGIIE